MESYSSLIFFQNAHFPLSAYFSPVLDGITSWEPAEGSTERNFLFSEVHFLYTKQALLIDSSETQKAALL